MELVSFVDFRFTEFENKVIDKIHIAKNLQFLNYYDEDKFENKVNIYTNDIGNNNAISEDFSKIIHRIVKKVLLDKNQESGIIWIRTRIDNNNNKFRWHRDGKYFNPINDEPIFKFALTLRGNSTPIVVDKTTIEKYDNEHKIYNEMLDYIFKRMDVTIDLQICLSNEYAYKYIDAIGDNYIQAKTKEGVYFANMINNSTKLGIIHSEPIIEKDRIFIAILPYTKEKCKAWIDEQILRNNGIK